MLGHELIVWNDNLVTGVTEMDEQHHILVNSINEANTRLARNINAEILDQITQDLLSYSLYHFETEESLMQIYHYAENKQEDSNIHIQEHQEFSSTVLAVREDLKVGHLISREKLLTFLNNWMIDHILNTDKRLGEFIVAKRAELAS